MKAGLLEKLPELPEGFFWRIERMPYKWFWLVVCESGSGHPFVFGSILDERSEESGKIVYAEILTDELVVKTSVRILEAFEEKRVELRKMEEKRAALEALEEAKKASLEYVGDYVAPAGVKAPVEWEKVRVADLVTGDLVRIVSPDGWCRRGPWVVAVGKDGNGFAYAFDVNEPGRSCMYDSQAEFSGEWLERPVKASEWAEVRAHQLSSGDAVRVTYLEGLSSVIEGTILEVGRDDRGRVSYVRYEADGGMKCRIEPSNFERRKFERKVK